MKLTILDDYQGVALDLAPWSRLAGKVDVTVEREAFADEDAAAAALADSEIVLAMRERTPFPRSLIERLPKLKLLVTTGMRNAAIDLSACKDRGVTVTGTSSQASPTVELTWTLILGAARGLGDEHRSMRDGGWQIGLGVGLEGKTLGVLGLGRLGSAVARIGRAFGMRTIAWSPNLTGERAAAAGAVLVERDALFREADFLTVHMVLSSRSRGLVSRELIGLMKPGAFIVNTSRSGLVDMPSLVAALEAKRLRGAAIDVYEKEPVAKDDPIRKIPNLTMTPHLGYVTEENYRGFYTQALEDIEAWFDGKPIRLVE